ncbi:MAG: putative integral rane efflux protein [Planctomycetaceae bacterium]|nr:putative integral rane efflux protein [Planctomycetaceae bacterium]
MSSAPSDESTPSSSHPPESPHPEQQHDPYAALRVPSYRRYLSGNFLSLLGMQMQGVAVGWEIWHRTNSTQQIGLVALLQFLPVLILGIPAGQLADRFPRNRILMSSLTALSLGSLGLAWVSWTRAPLPWMYAFLLLNGASKALSQPAKGAMLPLLVPKNKFTNAVTWNATVFELSSVIGPAFAGVLLAAFELPAMIYLAEGGCALIFLVLLFSVQMRPQAAVTHAASWRDLLGGLGFVWNHKLILGAISLDLFAVLLGGAVALYPVYADAILEVGPTGLGWMRAMPAVGALSMSFIIAHLPPMRHAGKTLLWCVAGFGIATAVFGLSRNIWLSLAALFMTGVFDTVSVVIRHTLIQTLTPDQMRGRVAAVNGIFIGASNELGGSESGYLAHAFERSDDIAFGPTVSVVAGGFGTLLVVGLNAWLFPGVRNYGRLDAGRDEPLAPAVETSQSSIDEERIPEN